jgi:hypothetical protein
MWKRVNVGRSTLTAADRQIACKTLKRRKQKPSLTRLAVRRGKRTANDD